MRKNINKPLKNLSEEDTLNDDEHITNQDSDFEGDEGDSTVDNEAEENNDLDASATDSDEDECDVDFKHNDKGIESKNEKIKKGILQRYQERQGKQLYMRFPHKIPETQESLEQKVREIVPLAVKVHKPRQRHVRFCLIDFSTKEDRDITLKNLKKSIKKGDLKKYVVNIPRTENSDFVNELTELKIKSIENKKAKLRLKKATKKSLKENNFTSSVIVFNLPRNATVLEIRELFPNAVDINIKPGKGKLNALKSIAAITFPTTLDARNAIKKKLSLGGNQLVIKFDNKRIKKNTENNDSKNASNDELIRESKPIVKKLKLEQTIYDAKEKMQRDGALHKQKLNKNVKNCS